ncbi:MAG: putative protein N(5)-glutamine methyltransferase, partial [Actinomycetota bacterium]|nr:putative protein N(5)-glutamine methyltransferase [Actinomycetota bacterium]
LRLHRRIAAQAPGWLARGGRLLIETSERQAPVAAGILAGQGLIPAIRRSHTADATVVTGVLPAGG